MTKVITSYLAEKSLQLPKSSSMVRTMDFPLNPDEFEPTGITMKPGGQSMKLEINKWTTRNASPVVMKMIKLSDFYDTQAVHREVALLAAAQHRCIVKFHGIIQDRSNPGQVTFVYSLASGGDLSGAMGKLTSEQQYSIAHDIVEGLAHLHSLKILHLDLKPANVLLDGGWMHAELADFGAARLDTNGETIMTRQPMTTICGAPEFAVGEVSRAADSWSLGMILYELVACKQMNPAPNRQFTLRKPIDLSAIKNRALRQLLSRCFLPAVERMTVEEIRERLTPAMFGATGPARPIGVTAQPAPAAPPAVPLIAKSPATQPPAKAAAQPFAKSPAVSRAPAAARIPTAPVGCFGEFMDQWELAHRGVAAAQLWIGAQFYFGTSGVTQDWSAAVSWFRKSAEGGNTAGMHCLASCYQNDEGVEKDKNVAVSWFRKSECSAAQSPLGGTAQLIAESPAVSRAPPATPILPAPPVGCDDGFRQQWEMAQRGDAAAQFWIGKQFSCGLSGVKQDENAAARWFQKSAEGGNSAGMFELGFCYKFGRGVEENLRAAASWLQKSAEGGNTDGMFELGLCYQDGEGVKKDLAKANFWYRKADREA